MMQLVSVAIKHLLIQSRFRPAGRRFLAGLGLGEFDLSQSEVAVVPVVTRKPRALEETTWF